MTKVKEVTIRGKKLEIYVDSHGNFSTNMNGGGLDRDSREEDNELSAPSLKELLEKADRFIKSHQTKVSIPFTRWFSWFKGEGGGWRGEPNKPTLRRGVITGVHAANGNVLVQWADTKKTEQDSRYGSRQVYLRMTPAEEKEYVQLRQLIVQTKARIEKLEEKYQIDLEKEIGDQRTRT